MEKQVVILTSTNLACNPRCLKEVRLLISQNRKVTVVAFNLHNWTDSKEMALNKELKGVEFHYLEATRNQFIPWLFSSFIEKTFRIIAPLFPANTFFQTLALSKRSWLLMSWAKKWRGSAALIIAHNPPAFYPASFLAKKLKVPFALDIEDFHPGEGNNKKEQTSVSLLMKKLIPGSVYTSYASPLIQFRTEVLVGKMDKTKNITINNLFSALEFPEPKGVVPTGDKLRFVWFSQIIDYGRGLEILLPVLDQFQNEIKLTLIGNRREAFYREEIEGRNYVSMIDPLSQSDLNKQLNNFDIGLALENVGADLNRSICLTNKIWAYFQAGLYILATDTEAQISFLDVYKDHGIIMNPGYEGMKGSVKQLIQNIEKIRSDKKMRYLDASAVNWETESRKLESKWEQILQ